MKILINVNEQISATMMEKHFQASNLEAEVTAAPDNMMLGILKAFQIDLLAYYAQEVDNAALISFFNSTGDVRKILFVKKQNLALVSTELEEMLDECFTLPLDSNDFMIRLRRMFRAVDQKKAEIPQPPQESAPQVQEQPLAPPLAPPQPVEQNIEPSAAFVATQTPQPLQSEPTAVLSEQEPSIPPIAPVQAVYTYTPENFRPQATEQTDLAPQQNFVQPATTGAAPLPTDSSNDFSAGTKHRDKKSAFVRFASVLSKTLFYILVFVVALLAVFMVKSKISGGTPSVLGYQLYGVLSGSMNGTQKTSFDTGSLVFVKAKDVQKIEVGDIITFRGLSIDAPLTTHRVVGINNEDSLSFVTRGDANSVNDPKPISAEKVVGTVRGHLPFIGYLTGFAETRTGLIFLVFVPGAIIITYELFNIYRTLKNDKKKRKDD